MMSLSGGLYPAAGGGPGAVPPEPGPLAHGLSTDPANGWSLLSHSALIQLLMDRTVPEDRLKHLNPRFLTGSALADDLPRDYPLNEIAIVTRAGPGWLLGLRVAPDYDDAVVRDLRKHFEAYSTVSFDNYPERACRTLRW